MKTEIRQENVAPLAEYFDELTAGETAPIPEGDTWRESLRRVRAGKGPAEIDEETYRWFLEAVPSQCLINGYFCLAEQDQPFRLFWRRGGRCFVRRLTWFETKNLCRLAGIRTYG